MSHSFFWSLVASAVLVCSLSNEGFAQPPPGFGPQGPPPCPMGYHFEGPRGCWPNDPRIPPLCPPHMAWRFGDCVPMGPPPPPMY